MIILKIVYLALSLSVVISGAGLLVYLVYLYFVGGRKDD